MSAALEQTLALLAEETRDEDKFAGLLLIAKTVRPDDADAVRKVFGAMSFRFLRRLLLTDHTEGGDERVLQEVSVSIVASFCDDESMATSPQMVGLAPALFKLLRSQYVLNWPPPTVFNGAPTPHPTPPLASRQR